VADAGRCGRTRTDTAPAVRWWLSRRVGPNLPCVHGFPAAGAGARPPPPCVPGLPAV